MQKICTVLYYVVTLGFFAFMVKYGIDLTMQKFAFNEMATAVAVPHGRDHDLCASVRFPGHHRHHPELFRVSP